MRNTNTHKTRGNDMTNSTQTTKTTKTNMVEFIITKSNVDQVARYEKYLMSHSKSWLSAMIDRINK